jgi:hypothetical protein
MAEDGKSEQTKSDPLCSTKPEEAPGSESAPTTLGGWIISPLAYHRSEPLCQMAVPEPQDQISLDEPPNPWLAADGRELLEILQDPRYREILQKIPEWWSPDHRFRDFCRRAREAGLPLPFLTAPKRSTTKPAAVEKLRRRSASQLAAAVWVGLFLGAWLGGLALGIAAVANAIGDVPYSMALGVWLDTAILVPLAAFVLPRMEPFGKHRPELRQIICLQFLFGLLGGAFATGRCLYDHESQIRLFSLGPPWATWLAAMLLVVVGLLVAGITSNKVRAAFVLLVFVGLATVAVCAPLLFGLVGGSKYSVVPALALAGGLAGLGTGVETVEICGPPGENPFLGALIWPSWVVLVLMEQDISTVGGLLLGVVLLILGVVCLFAEFGGWALLIVAGVYALGLLPYTRACRWLVSWRR